MTVEQIVAKSASLLDLAQKLLTAAYAIGVIIVAITIWVYSTSTTVADMKQVVTVHIADENAFRAETSKWRTDQEKNLVRLTVIAENQQKMLERQQSLLEAKFAPLLKR